MEKRFGFLRLLFGDNSMSARPAIALSRKHNFFLFFLRCLLPFGQRSFFVISNFNARNLPFSSLFFCCLLVGLVTFCEQNHKWRKKNETKDAARKESINFKFKEQQ